jgi:hypothetical protein
MRVIVYKTIMSIKVYKWVDATRFFCVHQCRRHTQSGDKQNAERVIVILVQRPQNNAGNLKDVERMDDLQSLVNAYYIVRG